MKKRQQESQAQEFPKPPVVREYSYKSSCHGAECISVPFYAEEGMVRKDKVCEVILCHAYVPKLVQDGEQDGVASAATRPCMTVKGVVRSHRDKYFGISVKTIMALADKGIFSATINNPAARQQRTVGIERAIADA